MKGKNIIDQNAKADYSFGYEKGVLDYLIYRAHKSLDFILPYLKPGKRVLECGCGPGIVTIEIAKRIINGDVIGIDIDKDQIDSNNKNANRLNIQNLKFEVANILELPYPDNFFDVVYMQALIVHIKNPMNAIREVHRVLKDQGMILIREPIMDRVIISPEEPFLLEAIELIQRAISSYGGDSSIGRKLWPILNEAGFTNILISTKWGQPDSFDEWPDFYEGWAKVYEGKIGDIILKEEWADEKRLVDMRNSFMNLGKSRRGYAAAPWGQAVGMK